MMANPIPEMHKNATTPSKGIHKQKIEFIKESIS